MLSAPHRASTPDSDVSDLELRRQRLASDIANQQKLLNSLRQRTLEARQELDRVEQERLAEAIADFDRQTS
jgi:hypothetical protein